MAGLLSRERIVAEPGFNRWLVPPAALAIHLSIGHGLRFQRLLAAAEQAIGITGPCRARTGGSFPQGVWPRVRLEDQHPRLDVHPRLRLSRVSRPPCSEAGSSGSDRGRAASQPPAAGRRASSISALGVYLHQIWLLWLGLRRASADAASAWATSRPVSTLIKWFPDRRGMATGMAIMGFGGGAMIGARCRRHPDEALRSPDLGRAWRDVRHHGRHLLRGDDVRRVPVPAAAAGLEAGGLDAAGRRAATALITTPARARGQAMQDRRSSGSCGRCSAST